MYLLFDLLWTFSQFPVIPALIVKFAEVSSGIMSLSGSLLLAKVLITAIYLSPSGLLDIANFWLSGGVGFAITIGNISPTMIGASPFYIILTGVFWIIIPFSLGVRFASRTD